MTDFHEKLPPLPEGMYWHIGDFEGNQLFVRAMNGGIGGPIKDYQESAMSFTVTSLSTEESIEGEILRLAGVMSQKLLEEDKVRNLVDKYKGSFFPKNPE